MFLVRCSYIVKPLWESPHAAVALQHLQASIVAARHEPARSLVHLPCSVCVAAHSMRFVSTFMEEAHAHVRGISI